MCGFVVAHLSFTNVFIRKCSVDSHNKNLYHNYETLTISILLPSGQLLSNCEATLCPLCCSYLFCICLPTSFDSLCICIGSNDDDVHLEPAANGKCTLGCRHGENYTMKTRTAAANTVLNEKGTADR